MKVFNKGRVWFTLLLAAVALVGIVTSFNYKPQARLLPLAACVPVLILSILVILGEKYPQLTRSFDVGLTDGGESCEPEPAAPPTRQGGRLIAAFIWGITLMALIIVFGFLVSIPVFMLLFMKVWGRVPWLNAILTSAITLGLMYGVFNVLIQMELFPGIVFGGIVPPL